MCKFYYYILGMFLSIFVLLVKTSRGRQQTEEIVKFASWMIFKAMKKFPEKNIKI